MGIGDDDFWRSPFRDSERCDGGSLQVSPSRLEHPARKLPHSHEEPHVEWLNVHRKHIQGLNNSSHADPCRLFFHLLQNIQLNPTSIVLNHVSTNLGATVERLYIN